jgi:hypothetical protein
MIHYDSGAVPTLSSVRVIAIALLIGPLVFAAVVAYLRVTGAFGGAVEVPYFDVGAAGLGVVMAVSAFGVRRAIFARGTAGTATHRPFAYLTGTLMFFGLLEGGILLNLVVALLVPVPWANIGVAAIGLALGASALPSEHQRADVGLDS